MPDPDWNISLPLHFGQAETPQMSLSGAEAGDPQRALFEAFIRAGEQAGYPVTRDYNGQQQEGFGPMEATIWPASTIGSMVRPRSVPQSVETMIASCATSTRRRVR